MNRNLFLCLVLAFGYVHSAPSLLPVSEAQENDLLCTICQSMVEDLRSLIGENATESQVEELFDDICNRLAAERELCTSTVHQYLPIIFDKISGGIDPKTACLDLKVCASNISNEISEGLTIKEEFNNEIPTEVDHVIEYEVDNLIPQILHPYNGRKGKPTNTKLKLASNETCEICEFLIQVLDASIATNQTEAAINNTIMQICDALPAELANFCKSLTPALLNILEKGVDPEKGCMAIRVCQATDGIVNIPSFTCDLCQSSMKEAFGKMGKEVCLQVKGVCDTKKAGSNAHKELIVYEEVQELFEGKMDTIPNEEEENIQANPLECELCKVLVFELNKLLITNQTDEVINATVYQICAEIPGDFCYNYAPQIVKLLENGFDSAVVCKLVRACTAAEEQEVHENVAANPLECELCKALVDELDQVLTNNRSEEIINTTIYQLCGEVPEALTEYCMTYAPRIVKLLETGFDPQSICTILRACSAGSIPVEEESYEPLEKESIEDFINEVLPKEVTNPEDTKCDVCKAIIQIIDRFLEDNNTRDAINGTVYGLCSDLPGQFKDVCESIAPQVVIAVESGLDPTVACTFVKLCSGAESIPVEEEDLETYVPHEKESLQEFIKDVLPNEINNPEDAKCDLCKAIIQIIDEYLENNKTRDTINSTVFGLCADLPEPFQDLCNQDAPQIVIAVETGLDPTTACTFVKLCTGGKGSFELLGEEIEDRVKDVEEQLEDGDTKCELCKLAINLVDQYIGRNTSKEGINSTVFKLCSMLPGDVKPACDLLAPGIVKAIDSGFDPASACAAVNICVNGTMMEMYEEEEEEPEEPVHETPVLPELEGIRADIEKTITEDIEAFGDNKCDFCEFAINLLDKYIAKNTSQIAINNTVYELCGFLPEDIKGLCNMIAPQVVKAVDSGFDPERACAAVQLCTNSSVEVILEPGLAEVEPIVKPAIQEVVEPREEEEEPRGEEEEPREEEAEPRVQEAEPIVEEVEPRVEEEETRVEEVEPREEETEPREEEAEPREEEAEPREEEAEPREEEVESREEEAEPREEEAEHREEEVEPREEEAEPREEEVEQRVENEVLPEEEHGIELEEPLEDVNREEERNVNHISEKVEFEEENVKADARCELCELIINIMDRYIQGNATQQKINETMYTLCSVLPSQLKPECMLIAPKIVSTIVAGLNPETTCTAANFCVNGTELEFPIEVPGLTCEVCHSLVELANPEKYDVEVADQLCGASCSRRHRRSVPEAPLLSLIQEASKASNEVLRGDPQWNCDVCEFAVKAMNVMLTDNATMDKVVVRLMKVCSYFPDPYTQKCEDSVLDVAGEFEKGLNVEEFCNSYNDNKCGTGSQGVELLFDTLGHPDDWECNICKKSLSTMNTLLDQDYEHIKVYMNNVCERLSAPYNKQCQAYIQTQDEQVFTKIIEKLLSPAKVCELAGVCSMEPEKNPNMSIR